MGLKPGHGPSAHQNGCEQLDTSLPNSARRICGVYSHDPACGMEGQSSGPWLGVALIGAMNYEKGSVFLNLPKRCVGRSKIARIAGVHTKKLGLPRPSIVSSKGVAARESDWLRTE